MNPRRPCGGRSALASPSVSASRPSLGSGSTSRTWSPAPASVQPQLLRPSAAVVLAGAPGASHCSVQRSPPRRPRLPFIAAVRSDDMAHVPAHRPAFGRAEGWLAALFLNVRAGVQRSAPRVGPPRRAAHVRAGWCLLLSGARRCSIRQGAAREAVVAWRRSLRGARRSCRSTRPVLFLAGLPAFSWSAPAQRRWLWRAEPYAGARSSPCCCLRRSWCGTLSTGGSRSRSNWDVGEMPGHATDTQRLGAFGQNSRRTGALGAPVALGAAHLGARRRARSASARDDARVLLRVSGARADRAVHAGVAERPARASALAGVRLPVSVSARWVPPSWRCSGICRSRADRAVARTATHRVPRKR